MDLCAHWRHTLSNTTIHIVDAVVTHVDTWDGSRASRGLDSGTHASEVLLLPPRLAFISALGFYTTSCLIDLHDVFGSDVLHAKFFGTLLDRLGFVQSAVNDGLSLPSFNVVVGSFVCHEFNLILID